MVVDAGHDLHLPAAAQKGAGGHVHLPQLHGRLTLPADVVRTPALPGHRAHQPVAHEGPIDGGAGDRGAPQAQLIDDPPRAPAPMGPPQLADRRLELRRGLGRMALRAVRAVHQARHALFSVAADPGMDRLPGDAIASRHLGHRDSGDHFQHCQVPLLDHCQLHKHGEQCQASSGANLSRINRSRTRPGQGCVRTSFTKIKTEPATCDGLRRSGSTLMAGAIAPASDVADRQQRALATGSSCTCKNFPEYVPRQVGGASFRK